VRAVHSNIGVANDGFDYIDGGGNNNGTLTTPKIPTFDTGGLANNGGLTKTIALQSSDTVAIDNGENPLGLTYDERDQAPYFRVWGLHADIGAYESKPAGLTGSPTISTVDMNGGATQRSRVLDIEITFDQHVELPSDATTAFKLSRQSDSKGPNLSAVVDDSGSGTVVTLTFTGGDAYDHRSLDDGLYTLVASASKISSGNFDGNANGIAGDDYTKVGTVGNTFFRLFGDFDADGMVSGKGSADYDEFVAEYYTGSVPFDWDDSGLVGLADYTHYKASIGTHGSKFGLPTIVTFSISSTFALYPHPHNIRAASRLAHDFRIGSTLPLQHIHVFDTDRPTAAVDRDNDRQTDRGFRRCNHEHEGRKSLPRHVRRLYVTPEGNQVNVDGVQHQLDAHQDGNRVAP
jgi:hypothetical protein